MNKFVVLAFLFLIPSLRALAYQVTVSPSFRLYPMNGYLSAAIKKEGITYDKRTETDSTNYGLWQISAAGDVTGPFEFAASYYPISFFRLTAAIGGSYRYYNNTAFNCSTSNCQGLLTRNRIGFGFMGMTGEAREWIVIPEYSLSAVSASTTNLPIADDSEIILANANGDTMDRYQILAGKKIESQFYGLMLRQAQYRSSGQHNELQAAMTKIIWRDTSFMMGLGRYASDLNVPGVTFFATYEWRWGYSQALF